MTAKSFKLGNPTTPKEFAELLTELSKLAGLVKQQQTPVSRVAVKPHWP